MKIIVPIQVVPDLVEELKINPEGTALELDDLVWKLNEYDDHAIEQAILIKEKSNAQVTIVAPGYNEIDEALYTAAAKNADHLVKINANFKDGFNNHALARLFKPFIEEAQPDLVLTGVSNHNSFDGVLGPILAEYLGLPYVGYVSGVKIEDSRAVVQKDYPGGIRASLEVTLPAVLGIASAETPPRYVPISRIRQAMKSSLIEEKEGNLDLSGGLIQEKVYEPEVSERAEMLKGHLDDIVERLVQILKDQGLL